VQSQREVTELYSKFEQALATPEDALAEVRGFLAEVSQPESERRPASDQWSIGEIAHHLVLVTRRFAALPEIVATQTPDRFEYGLVTAARGFTLPDVADVTKSGKGMAPDPVRPTAGGNIQQLAEELTAAWEQTKAALQRIANHDLSRFYYEHYRLGPLNLYETIAFHGYHAQKHLNQMKRTIAQIRI
jgi:hypothetical protein